MDGWNLEREASCFHPSIQHPKCNDGYKSSMHTHTATEQKQEELFSVLESWMEERKKWLDEFVLVAKGRSTVSQYIYSVRAEEEESEEEDDGFSGRDSPFERGRLAQRHTKS